VSTHGAIVLSVLLMIPSVGCSSGESNSSTPTGARPGTQAAAGGQESQESPDSEETTDSPEPLGGGFFVAEGAPDPLACAADTDCAYDGAVNAEGCCWSYRGVNAVAMSTAYRDWQAAHREANCADVDCPPPPVPTRPEECLFEVSCVDAQCQNACNR